MPLSASIESNEMIDRLPDHLKQFIKPQIYTDYSPVDQAVWRYVMKKNVAYLSKVAHGSYVEGLKKTGISIESIPSMYGMNRILKEIGWAAVAVDGFIPPNAFMEFQAYKVLVIAADIRQLKHIEYTPSPDIIHEAAGHAPMIANPDYAEYLRRLGAVGAKTIWSHYDGQLYEAIRKLSILKEAPGADPKEISRANDEVEDLQRQKVSPSEMAQLRNLQWWTVEYGLIGDMQHPKIYGAGLLSSIGESEWCMRPQVKKIPYSIEAASFGFDITQPQPQLFVTPDFTFLMDVLEEFSNGLGLRTGGKSGLTKLIDSAMTGTIELDSGLQISGLFTGMRIDEKGNLSFVEMTGGAAFAFSEKEIIGHGTSTYSTGFSFPLGKIRETFADGALLNEQGLNALHPAHGASLKFLYENGSRVEGTYITGYRNVQGQLLFVELTDATLRMPDGNLVEMQHNFLTIPLAENIVAAYSGAADVRSFPGLYTLPQTETPHPVKTAAQLTLESMYQQVRSMRTKQATDEQKVATIFSQLKKDYPEDWLLTCELLELTENHALRNEMTSHLERLSASNDEVRHLIQDGVQMLK
jgi:phenylalanine-4-hydroxylase